MSWDVVKGNWKEIRGKVKQKWAKLTDDDLTAIDGKKDELSGKLQKYYGYAKNDAEREIDNFVTDIKDEPASNQKTANR